MINQKIVSLIASQINTKGVDEAMISALRREYAPIHFTYCSDDDIPNNEPVLEQEKFNLYLINGHDHCLCLTNDFDYATGVVVAEVYQD